MKVHKFYIATFISICFSFVCLSNVFAKDTNTLLYKGIPAQEELVNIEVSNIIEEAELEETPVLPSLENLETSDEPIEAKEKEISNYKSRLTKYEIINPIKKEFKNYVAREYLLGPNDKIDISVAGITELTQPGLMVNPEGKLNIMHIGYIDVAGLTLEQLKKIITEEYRVIVVKPEVVINMSQSRPFIVYISGAILNPGSYELNTVPNASPYFSKPEAFIERKTPLLSNILVASGGLSYDADIEHVRIENELDGSSIEVDLYKLINESKSSEDVFLMGGDKVIVPRLPSPAAIDYKKYKILATSTLFQRTIPVRVIGYVNRPGLVTLDSAQSSNVNSAIATAGGYLANYGDYPRKVRISRVDNNNKLVTIEINPIKNDMVLMPNDIVYVPEKTMPLIAKFFDYTIRLMNPFAVFSNTYKSLDTMNW